MRSLAALVITGLLPLSAGAQTPPAVRVEMTEFAFRPAMISVVAERPVRLVLINRGQIAHQFQTVYLRGLPVAVSGETLYAESAALEFIRLDPGGTARLDFLPRRKGRFVFVCSLEGHREAGMQGVLEIR